MTKQKSQGKAKENLLQIFIDKETKHAFRVKCAQLDKTMREVLTEFVVKLIKQ